MNDAPKTKRALIADLTEAAIRERLSLGPEAVRAALHRDALLPSWWYDDCDQLARAKGYEAPRNLFAFGARKPRFVPADDAA